MGTLLLLKVGGTGAGGGGGPSTAGTLMGVLGLTYAS